MCCLLLKKKNTNTYPIEDLGKFQPWVRGVSKTKVFKGKYEAKLGGRVLNQKIFLCRGQEGIDIFQNNTLHSFIIKRCFVFIFIKVCVKLALLWLMAC